MRNWRWIWWDDGKNCLLWYNAWIWQWGTFFLDRIKAFAQTIRRGTCCSSRWRETTTFLLVFQARSWVNRTLLKSWNTCQIISPAWKWERNPQTYKLAQKVYASPLNDHHYHKKTLRQKRLILELSQVFSHGYSVVKLINLVSPFLEVFAFLLFT